MFQLVNINKISFLSLSGNAINLAGVKQELDLEFIILTKQDRSRSQIFFRSRVGIKKIQTQIDHHWLWFWFQLCKVQTAF